MSSPAYIDAEELPFTPDELYGAARAFLPDVGARQMAEHLAACGPELVAERARRRAGWRRAGLVGADTMLLHGWTYPDALLPALAALSPEAAARVATLQARVEIAGRTAVPAARTEAGELGVVATELRRIGVDPEVELTRRSGHVV